MLLTYGEYTALGYSRTEAEFLRFEPVAAGRVARYTSGRVTAGNISDLGRRGVCEIIEALSSGDVNGGGSAGGALRSFSNLGYGESYERALTADEAIAELCAVCFGPDAAWRGVR